MKTIAVIQARLGSTRLPQKILLPLAGKSMLQNVVERVSRAKLIDFVVVAYPVNDASMIAPQVPYKNAIFAYQGNENDLIGRFLACGLGYQADFIVRICADNPCVEAEEIDRLISKVAVYPEWRLIMNSEDTLNEHDGFGGELYSVRMLKWMDETIKSRQYREHPHKFWINMDCFWYVGKSYPLGFRLDVNTQADYEKVKSIYDHFGHNHFSVKEAMEFLGAQDLEKRHLPA